MARQPRIEFVGALYHVMSRGIERREIFRDDADRARYLSILGDAVVRLRFRLYSYCLMGNHVHLAVEAGKTPLSRIMRSINTRYVRYFNGRHRRSGYLFQGRYKAFLVEEDEYLLTLVRYIHENPVRGGLAATPGHYRWSSHRSYLRRAPAWLSSREVLARFGRTASIARRNFQEFFRMPEKRPYASARRYVQTIVGEEGFARQVLERADPVDDLVRRVSPEDLIAWVEAREKISGEELSGPGRSRNITRVRALCGYLAREAARMPLSRIARQFNRDPSTLWRDVRHLEQEMKSDRERREHVNALRTRFIRWGNTA